MTQLQVKKAAYVRKIKLYIKLFELAKTRSYYFINNIRFSQCFRLGESLIKRLEKQIVHNF